MCVCSDGCFRLTFGGSLVRHARFADFDNVNFGGNLVRNARFADFDM